MEKNNKKKTQKKYGKPQETDPEGIYRSQDGGNSWVLINKDNLYGGTGNGNFLVGDMNEFGTVYMSTVGCGIIYGKLSDSPNPPVTTAVTSTVTPSTTTTVITSVKPTNETNAKPTKYGDVNVDGSVNIADVVALNMYLLGGEDNNLSVVCIANADVLYDNVIDSSDSLTLMNYVAMIITESELGPQG